MLLGVLAALAAAVAFGVAALAQAVAARREAARSGLDPRLLLRLLRQPAFAAALALNLAGFGLHLAALRLLPLFLAQTIVAASVAVTAVLGARMLHSPLTRHELAAVLGLCAGLALLTATAAETGSAPVDAGTRLLLLLAVVGVAGVGGMVERVPGRAGASLLGLVAGLGFAIVAVSARVVPSLSPLALLTDPAAYALVGAGAVATLLYTTALQRASVLTSTATVVLAQTVGPAAVGVLALGDAVRDGTVPLAAVGLVLAVGGAVALARFDPSALAAGRAAGRQADA